MEIVSSVIEVAQTPVFWAALLAVSEVLALIPAIKANSIFQAIVNGIKKIAKKE